MRSNAGSMFSLADAGGMPAHFGSASDGDCKSEKADPYGALAIGKRLGDSLGHL